MSISSPVRLDASDIGLSDSTIFSAASDIQLNDTIPTATAAASPPAPASLARCLRASERAQRIVLVPRFRIDAQAHPLLSTWLLVALVVGGIHQLHSGLRKSIARRRPAKMPLLRGALLLCAALPARTSREQLQPSTRPVLLLSSTHVFESRVCRRRLPRAGRY